MTTPPIIALDREAAALLPCPNPWCSSARQRYLGGPFVRYYESGCYFRVCCPVCPQIGPSGDTEEAAIAAWNTRTAAERATSPAGEGGQDRKFAFRDGRFVNRVSGEAIPLDEPIIIFRARDRHAEHVLRDYLSMVEDLHHQQAIRDRMTEFAAWREAHPDRMKEPGITRDIRLSPAGDAGEVERVARAIFEAEPDDEYDWDELDAERERYPDDAGANAQDRARRRARAAIAALRPQAGDADVVGEPGA